MRFAADYEFKPAGKLSERPQEDFLAIYLTEFSYQSSSKILGSLNSWPCCHSEA